jgi:hypothetical protein
MTDEVLGVVEVVKVVKVDEEEEDVREGVEVVAERVLVSMHLGKTKGRTRLDNGRSGRGQGGVSGCNRNRGGDRGINYRGGSRLVDIS